MSTRASYCFLRQQIFHKQGEAGPLISSTVSKKVFYYTNENFNDFLDNKQFRVTGL